MNHIILGTVTLLGAIAVSLSMLRSARVHLNNDERKRFNVIRHTNRAFFPISIGLLAFYLVIRYALPGFNLVNVLFLWTSYNIILWIKMRRVMYGFQRAMLPPNFQLNYIFAQIISYTGLVASMLILLQGKTL